MTPYSVNNLHMWLTLNIMVTEENAEAQKHID